MINAGDNGETYDNVPKNRRQLGQVITWSCGIGIKQKPLCRPIQCYVSYFQWVDRKRVRCCEFMKLQWTRTDRHWNRIYATPSNILRSSGSVGVSLIMWLVGAFIAACGTTVFVELGTVCFSLNPISGPCLCFLSRDFLGVEVRRITSNTFTVVPNSWRRVFSPFIPS